MVRKEISYGQKSLLFYYYRFKDSPYFLLGAIGITIVVCLFLIINIIIPQVSDWLSIRQEVIATNERIRIERANINYLNNVDKNVLQSQLQTAVLALPSEKDFGNDYINNKKQTDDNCNTNRPKACNPNLPLINKRWHNLSINW